MELCVWSLTHPQQRHPAIFSLLRVVSRVNYASSLDKRALFSLGLEYRFLPSIRFNITVNYVGQVPAQEASKLHDPQYRRERLLVSFTQPLTGKNIIFLKLNILSLAKKNYAKDKHIARERIDNELNELLSPPTKISEA